MEQFSTGSEIIPTCTDGSKLLTYNASKYWLSQLPCKVTVAMIQTGMPENVVSGSICLIIKKTPR